MERLRGLYIISVAARLLEMHPQTLRKYERAGFLSPSRTGGMLRLYSDEDIARLRIIKHLVDDRGLNLAGVELALDLTSKLFEIRQALESANDHRELKDMVAAKVEDMLQLLGAGPP